MHEPNGWNHITSHLITLLATKDGQSDRNQIPRGPGHMSLMTGATGKLTEQASDWPYW